MKVQKEAVVAMFEELGSKSAGEWAPKRMMTKIQALPKALDADHEWEDAANGKTAKKLLKALKNEEEIEIVTSEAAAPEPEPEPTPAPKKTKKAPVVAVEEEDDDDEDDDDEDDEEEDDDEPA